MDGNEIAKFIKKIAKLEARGKTQAVGVLKQELFTNGVDYPDIEKMVKKASGRRAHMADGTFRADDKKTLEENEAYETGKKPAKKAPKKAKKKAKKKAPAKKK